MKPGLNLWFVHFSICVLFGLAMPESFWTSAFLNVYLAAIVLFLSLACFYFLPIYLPHKRKLYTKPISPYGMIGMALLFIVLGFFLYQNPLGLFLDPPAGRGDSLLLIRSLPVHTRFFSYQASYDELLELYFHSRFYAMAEQYLGWDLIQSVGMHNFLAFGLFALIYLQYVKDQSRFFVLASLLTIVFTPRLTLFAGYIENYTWSGLYLLFVLWFCARQISSEPEYSRNRTLILFGFLGMISGWSVLHHLITGFMAPALIYFTWCKSHKKFRSFVQNGIAACCGALVVMTVVFLYIFSLDHTPTLDNAHVANPPYLHPRLWFAKFHLMDMLNISIFSSSSLLVMLLLLYRTGNDKSGTGLRNHLLKVYQKLCPDSTTTFLLIATLSFWTNSFFVNAIISYPADWDMNNFQSIPTGLYVLYRLNHYFLYECRNFKQTISMLLAISLTSIFVSLSWVHSNAARSTQSDFNLLQSQTTAQNSIRVIQENKLWPLIKNQNRQLEFVNFNIFVEHSRLVLESVDDPTLRKHLNDAINREKALFYKSLFLDEKAYQISRQQMYKNLAPVNMEISRIQKNYNHALK